MMEAAEVEVRHQVRVQIIFAAADFTAADLAGIGVVPGCLRPI